MARAGYDPRDMANMFQTLQAKGGSSGPEWMSSHPNPGNRYDAITKEAAQLQVSNPVRNTQEFTQVRSRLQRMAPAPTTEQAMRNGGNRRTSRDTGYPSGQIGQRATAVRPVSRPSMAETCFVSRVPSNWRELQGRQLGDVCARGRLRRYPGPERVHARLAGRHGRQQRARPSHGHQTADAATGAEQSEPSSERRIQQRSVRGAARAWRRR